MTAPRTRSTPRTDSTPAAGTLVPAHASSPETTPSTDRLAYSVDEAARLTGLSRDLLYDEMRRGNLPYRKVGRRRLITRHHLQQFLGLASPPENPPQTRDTSTARSQTRYPNAS
jgi:excisionase family DNA binding protein